MTSGILTADIDIFAQRLQAANDLEAIFAIVLRYCQDMGFERFAYWLIWPPEGVDGQRLQPICITNYLEEWSQHYGRENMAHDDYVTTYSAKNILPFVWHEIVSRFKLTKRQKLVFTDAADIGMKEGATVPVHGVANSRAMFSVAGDMKKASFDKLFEKNRHALHLSAQYLHDRIMQLGFGKKSLSHVQLTPREVEVLTQMAIGKTREWAAINLNISSETVKAHLENAREKIGAANTTNAVAIALIHGLINIPQKGNLM